MDLTPLVLFFFMLMNAKIKKSFSLRKNIIILKICANIIFKCEHKNIEAQHHLNDLLNKFLLM